MNKQELQAKKAQYIKQLNDIAHEKVLSDSAISMLTQIMKVESYGQKGDPAKAKNPESTATGLFQFTKGTWERFGKKYGDITDPEAQINAVIDFTLHNQQKMLAAGIKPDTADFYKAHFAGAESENSGAILAIKSAWDPSKVNEPLSTIFSPEVMEANSGIKLKLSDGKTKDFKDFTIGEFNNWASVKMGEKPKYDTTTSNKGDIVEALGDMVMTVVEHILKVSVYFGSGIGSIFSSWTEAGNNPTPPATTPNTPNKIASIKSSPHPNVG